MITTILIAGLLTKERLDRTLEEIRGIATCVSTNDNLVLVFNSPGGDSFAVLRFLESVLGDERMRYLAERAAVKIYEAHSGAALLAFALGSEREMSADATIGFHLGETTVQVGNSGHFDQDGRLANWIAEGREKYRTAVTELIDRLLPDIDGKLNAQLWGSGRLDLSAKECLHLGLVTRLF